jgi:hypothetical protein
MVNLFELKKSILEKIGSGHTVDEEYGKLRSYVSTIVWDKYEKCSQYEKCMASILMDVLDYCRRDEEKMLMDPSNKNLLPYTFWSYRFIIDENGRTIAGAELSAQVFTKTCLELGIDTLYMGISGNWSSSCVMLEKVICGLGKCEWKLTGLKDKKLVLEINKEVEGN